MFLTGLVLAFLVTDFNSIRIPVLCSVILLYIEIKLLGMLLYQLLLSRKNKHIFFIWQNKMSHILRFPLLRLLAWSANPGHNQEATKLNNQYGQAGGIYPCPRCVQENKCLMCCFELAKVPIVKVCSIGSGRQWWELPNIL